MSEKRAFMRVLGQDEVDLPIVLDDPPIVIVEVAGFGHLVVGDHPTEGWKAELQPFRTTADQLRVMTAAVGERLFPPSKRPKVKLIDKRVEIEMLHKGDRLDVVIEGIVA